MNWTRGVVASIVAWHTAMVSLAAQTVTPQPASDGWYVAYLKAARPRPADLVDAHRLVAEGHWGGSSISLELNLVGLIDRSRGRATANAGIGVTPYYRYAPGRARGSQMFLEVGIGAVYYAAAYPAGGSRLNFTRQFGAGIRRRVRTGSFIAGLRWYHSSNQNMFGRDRNPGLDAVGMFVGREGRRHASHDPP